MALSEDIEIASTIADLLSRLSPDNVLQCEPFLTALQNFMHRGGTAFHDALFRIEHSPGYRRQSGQKRKRQDSGLPALEQAREFFEEHKQKKLEQGPSASLRDLLQAVSTIATTCATSQDHGSLFHLGSSQTTRRSDERVLSNRQVAVLDRLSEGDQKTLELEGLRRLRLLRIKYEVERLQSDTDRQLTSNGASETPVAAGIRSFSELSGKAEDEIKALRKSARPYEVLARYQNGLGMILILGCDTRALWERKLSDRAIALVWQFCVKHMPDVMVCARKLQPLACEMIESDFGGIRGDPAELRTSGHIFSRHFGLSTQNASRWDEDAALQTLAIAAHQRNEEVQSSGQAMLSVPEPPHPIAPDLGLDTLARAAGALQAHGSTTEQSSEPGTLVQRDQHLLEAPLAEPTTFLQAQHGDDRATESLPGITLPSGGAEHEAASRRDVFRSSLNVDGLGESSYLGTSADLTNWRSADQSQYIWQENEVTGSNWGGWWEDWNLGGINVSLVSDSQSAL